MSLILLLTLAPHQSESIFSTGIAGFLGSWSLADTINNLLLFLPLGVATAFGRRGWKAQVLFAACLSLTVEIAQLGIPGRFSSVFDIVANTAGAAAGVALVRNASIWMRPPRDRARLAGVAAAATALLILIGGVSLFRLSIPRNIALLGRYTVQYSHLEPYMGRVLDVRVADIHIPPTNFPERDRLRRLLLAGVPLHVDFIAGPRPRGPAAIFNLVDARRRDVIQIAADRADVVLSVRTRANALLLNAPHVRIVDALQAVRPGDRVSVAVWQAEDGWCVGVNETSHCGNRFAVGDTWNLLVGDMPGAIALALSLIWVAVLFLPAGFWLPDGVHVALTGIVATAALVAVPKLVPAPATPTGQLIALWAGLLAGCVVRWGLSRVRGTEPRVPEGRGSGHRFRPNAENRA